MKANGTVDMGKVEMVRRATSTQPLSLLLLTSLCLFFSASFYCTSIVRGKITELLPGFFSSVVDPITKLHYRCVELG